MELSEKGRKVLSFIADKPDFDRHKERLVDEIQQMDRLSIIDDLLEIYKKLTDGDVQTGDKNVLNSLVAYFLGITTLKPTASFGVEKRRTYGRAGFPDIDMDFDYARRYEIIEYLQQKYGEDRVGNIGTTLTLKTKAAVRKAVEILDPENSIDYSEPKLDKSRNYALQNEILNTLPKSQSAFKKRDGSLINCVDDAVETFSDFARYMKQYPEVYRVAKGMEGSISAYGCHAAGVVISPIPLEQICPLHITHGAADDDLSKKTVATQFSMEDVESLGLIKFDVLGLSTKTALAMAVKLVKANHGVDIDLSRLPLEDKSTLTLLAKGDTDGCFQAEKTGMKQTFRQIGIDSFDDLIVAIAMYRPGPKDYIPELSDRKTGKHKIEFPHPLLRKITQRTYGIMAYQEQVMQAFMALADLTASDGYMFMKGCAKKKVKIINNFKDQFLKASVETGVPATVAKKIWDDMEKFGGYAFNKTLYFSEGIVTSKGEYSIEELFFMDRDDLPQVYSPDGDLIDIVNVYDHGFVPMYKVTFSDGSEVKCTGHHKFLSNIGILPLYEIIERGAQVVMNGGINNASQKRSCLSGLRTMHKDSKASRRTQKRMPRLEAEKVNSLRLGESQKFKTILGQYNRRRDAAVSIKDVQSSFKGYSAESERKETSISTNDSVEYGSLYRVSTESYPNSQGDFIQAGYDRSKDGATEKMAGRTSRRVLREVHQACNGAENLEVCSRGGIEGNISSNGVQIFSSSYKQGVLHQIETSPGGFSGLRQKDHCGVRWAAPFPRWIWETSKNVCSEGQATKRSYEESGVSCDQNVLRHLGSPKKAIQVYRDGNANRCDHQQSRPPSRDVHRSYVQVVNLEPIGFCQGYDLEVDSDDHLYCLSSGIVNSNSHATSYAYECWKTAYLKAHYMLEFMASRLSVEAQRRDFDLVSKYEDDLRKHNYKIVPPELNLSKMHYVKIGERELLCPLIIRDVGDKAAHEIIANQPYKGNDLMYAFASKVGSAVNSKVVEALCDAKLFGAAKPKAQLLRDFDTIKSDRKRGIGRQKGDLFNR